MRERLVTLHRVTTNSWIDDRIECILALLTLRGGPTPISESKDLVVASGRGGLGDWRSQMGKVGSITGGHGLGTGEGNFTRRNLFVCLDLDEDEEPKAVLGRVLE
ncbi:hypothetical protein HYC85_005099 [Camellia sinensis]|uniref:Uncharacterized protein n=1 Tax=Camellia sinensis TaxID=4442 RepID=A0A7J7I0D5_CAMSI|nr:hypothetical protein HYC85_005099 [Camellia sinensis]